jgi:Collagen triple helix repeat (20 copies)
MRFLLGGRARWAALGVIVAGLAAGGIAYASIPDAGGVIHTCFDKAGGRLYVIDTGLGQQCNSVTQGSLNFNQIGPQGPTGPSGLQGPSGVQGPSGPSGQSGTPGSSGPSGPSGPPGAAGAAGTSDLYIAHANGFNVIDDATETVVTKDVPAGNYAIFAKLSVRGDLDSSVARCVMRANGVLVDDTNDFTVDDEFTEFVPLQGAASMATAGPILVECNDSGADQIIVETWWLSAIKVSTIQ